jgi:hypothetical protein
MLFFILPQRTQSLTQSYTEEIYVTYIIKVKFVVAKSHISLLVTNQNEKS